MSRHQHERVAHGQVAQQASFDVWLAAQDRCCLHKPCAHHWQLHCRLHLRPICCIRLQSSISQSAPDTCTEPHGQQPHL